MNTLTKTISNSVMGICGISLWVSNITPTPLEVLSFLYTLYGQASRNNSEVDIELSVLFLELLQSEVNEYQGKPITQVFLLLIQLTIMLESFNPPINLFLCVLVELVLVSPSLANDMNLF